METQFVVLFTTISAESLDAGGRRAVALANRFSFAPIRNVLWSSTSAALSGVIRTLRGMASEVTDLLESARIQGKNRRAASVLGIAGYPRQHHFALILCGL
jgi:hypothetical protein